MFPAGLQEKSRRKSSDGQGCLLEMKPSQLLEELMKGDKDSVGGTESSLGRAGARWGLHGLFRSDLVPGASASRCPGIMEGGLAS